MAADGGDRWNAAGWVVRAGIGRARGARLLEMAGVSDLRNLANVRGHFWRFSAVSFSYRPKREIGAGKGSERLRRGGLCTRPEAMLGERHA